MSKFRSFPVLITGIWLLLFVTNPGRNETVDVAIRQIVARQLWSEGTVAVTTARFGFSAWIPTGPNRWVAPYGIGQSILFVPFDMAGSVLEHLGHAPQVKAEGDPIAEAQLRGEMGERLAWLPIGLGLLPLLGVAYWYAIRALLQEWGFMRPWPTLGALTLMLGTIMFHYAGQPQEETLIGFCLTLSMLFALRLRRRPVLSNAIRAGLFAGACLLTRPVSVLALLIVPVLIATIDGSWSARLRLLAAAGLACAAAVAVALWYNFARFGSPFTFGYDRLGHFSKIALDARSPRIFLSLLVDPGFGLLILSPVLAIAIYGFRRLWDCDRWYAAGMLLALLSCYSFFSCWHDSYTGGVAWGTRYQCHILPIFAVPLTLGLESLSKATLARRLAVVIIVLSTTIQGLSVFATHQFEPFQASCDGMADGPLRDSVVHGQLERRIGNVARWAVGAPPPKLLDPACEPTAEIMWDRYFPNFWGPVYAHRMARGGGWLLVFWSALLTASFFGIWLGIRREISASEGLSLPRKAPA